MKQPTLVYFMFILISCYLINACKSVKNKETINTDTIMRSYGGYKLIKSTKEEIWKDLQEKGIRSINFKKGEVIADIGAGNGQVEVMLSLFFDSLTFYVQDIDTFACNQRELNKVIEFYHENYKKNITCKFIAVKGSHDQTNLPDSTFDKVLILWTYSYFKNPRAIMMDLQRKLKKEALVYIINPDIEIENSKSLNKQYGWNASPIDKEISDVIECGYELINVKRNYLNEEVPFVLIFKKKAC
jgi:ubiquinone/menaquinone biosynthesis C-methylase UbiE